MKRGEKMTAKQRAAHTKRMRAAWRNRKANGASGVVSENVQEAVRARVAKLVQAEIQRQLAEIG